MFREKYEECSEKMIVERKKREEGREGEPEIVKR